MAIICATCGAKDIPFDWVCPGKDDSLRCPHDKRSLQDVALESFSANINEKASERRYATLAATRITLGDSWVTRIKWEQPDDGVASIDGVLLHGTRTTERRPNGETRYALEAVIGAGKWQVVTSLADLGELVHKAQIRFDKERFPSG